VSINCILSWFPAAWRARYETEVRELLEAQPIDWRIQVDLTAACVDAWLRAIAQLASPRLRRACHISLRISALLLIGGVGTLGADMFAFALEAASWWTSTVRVTANVAGLLTLLVAVLFFIRPFIDDPARRPGLLPSLSLLSAFFVALALDGSTTQLGDVVGFGMIATMRYSWFHIGTGRPPLSVPRSVLRLR
jgi:hypothetical protein